MLANSARKANVGVEQTGGRMKRLIFAATLFTACATAAHAQTQQELQRDGAGGSTDNVLTPAALQRAEPDQQEHGEAPGAGLDPVACERIRRAGPAARVQRRPLRG